MKQRIQIFIAFTWIILLSCNTDRKSCIESGNCIMGTWVDPEYSDNTIVFTKNDELKENSYGITFKKGGSFIERKNSGWCGTPPISYADFNGSWEENNSVINISVPYWGGTTESEWEIISLNSHNLKIKIINEIYNQE